MQVVALPLERVVRALEDLEEQVAGGAAAGAHLALPGQLDVRAAFHPGRNPDLDGAARPDPAVAVALRAWPADDRAVAAAAGARPRGHHLAEERARHLADLTAAAADVAGLRVGARRAALARAGRAHDRRVHHQLAGGAERALVEVQLDPDRGVAAAARPAARPAGGRPGAEERVHDVAEREAGPEPAGAGTAGRGERVRAQVVHLPLVRVGQHLVRLGDLLEPVLRLRVGVDVRVQLARQPPVGLLDLLRARVAADAEHGVVVRRH